MTPHRRRAAQRHRRAAWLGGRLLSVGSSASILTIASSRTVCLTLHPCGRLREPATTITPETIFSITRTAGSFAQDRGCSGMKRQLAPSSSSASRHSRRFRDVRDESGLPPTSERLRRRSEPTLRVTQPALRDRSLLGHPRAVDSQVLQRLSIKSSLRARYVT